MANVPSYARLCSIRERVLRTELMRLLRSDAIESARPDTLPQELVPSFFVNISQGPDATRQPVLLSRATSGPRGRKDRELRAS